jgi:hypothetical protein
MKEKGVIREIIPWADTRRKLFWRFRRRLLENKLMQKVTQRPEVKTLPNLAPVKKNS